MRTFNVKIEGVSPLLQHRFGEVSESGDVSRPIVQKSQTPREAAEAVAFFRGEGDERTYYVPGTWIAGCLRDAGASHKMKGSRKSVKYIVPAGVTINEVDITLLNGDGGPAKDFEVDSRPVVIPSTKGRIMRHRPRFEQWSLEFSIAVDEEVISSDLTKQLLDEGGRRVGIGDFRPAKTGPFGRFSCVSWEEVE